MKRMHRTTLLFGSELDDENYCDSIRTIIRSLPVALLHIGFQLFCLLVVWLIGLDLVGAAITGNDVFKVHWHIVRTHLDQLEYLSLLIRALVHE